MISLLDAHTQLPFAKVVCPVVCVQVFLEESQPLIDQLKESGHVTEIDATADEDSVFAFVEPVMDLVQDRGVRVRISVCVRVFVCVCPCS